MDKLKKELKKIEKKKKVRLMICLGELTNPMTRKVDTYEYDSLSELINKDEVPIKEIKEIFTDKDFYKYYKKKWL